MILKKRSVYLGLLASITAATFYTVAPWVNASRPQAGAANTPPASVHIVALPSKAHADGTMPQSEVPHAPSESSRLAADSKGDAFISLSWAPPVSPVVMTPPEALPMPAPTAPPLPFAFVGLLEKGADHPMAFVAKGEVLLIVAAGDIIDDNTYRVEALSAQQIVVTYLPIGIQQTLNIIGTPQ